MAGFKLSAFAGMAPRVGKTLLKDSEAQKAVNTDLGSGELRSWRKPGRLSPRVFVPTGTKTIFRYKDTDGDDLWLNWTTDVNVVRGPIYALNDDPIYYTGDGTPKKTNRTLATANDSRALGVPNPTSAPTVTHAGGTGAVQTRFYIYTFVSQFGSIKEESGPSPVSIIDTGKIDATYTVAGLPASAPAGDYNITKVRIYRSVTGNSANAYLFVGEVNIGTTSFTDNATASQLGPAITTSLFEPPPDDLKGIVAGNNGILAGFRGNEIFFSETFQPHAWPSVYAVSVELPVIGLAPYGESFIVMTTGNPAIITGSAPAAMTVQPLPINEPCVSKRSIVVDEMGVMYASPNGVVRVAQGFAGVVTKSLFGRDEWQAYQPSTMVGAIRSGEYYLFSSSIDFLDSRGGLILDRDDQASAFTVTSLYTEAVFTEPTSAELFIVEDGEIKAWEGDQNNFLPYEWKSKVFILPRPLNMGAVQIEAEFGDIAIGEALQQAIDELIAENEAAFPLITDFQSTVNALVLNGGLLNDSPLLNPLPNGNVDGRYVTLKVFCNDRQVASMNIRDRRMYRLPSGFKGDRWEFLLTGNVPLRHLKVAETSRELVNL